MLSPCEFSQDMRFYDYLCCIVDYNNKSYFLLIFWRLTNKLSFLVVCFEVFIMHLCVHVCNMHLNTKDRIGVALLNRSNRLTDKTSATLTVSQRHYSSREFFLNDVVIICSLSRCFDFRILARKSASRAAKRG